jgi:hypothetical protein
LVTRVLIGLVFGWESFLWGLVLSFAGLVGDYYLLLGVFDVGDFNLIIRDCRVFLEFESWRSFGRFDLVCASITAFHAFNDNNLSLSSFGELDLLLISALSLFLRAHRESVSLIRVSAGANIRIVCYFSTPIILTALRDWISAAISNSITVGSSETEHETTSDAFTA